MIKHSSKSRLFKVMVMGFGVVDCVAIYAAHSRLNQPVPEDTLGDNFVYAAKSRRWLASEEVVGSSEANSDSVVNPEAGPLNSSDLAKADKLPVPAFGQAPQGPEKATMTSQTEGSSLGRAGVEKVQSTVTVARADLPRPAFGHAAPGTIGEAKRSAKVRPKFDETRAQPGADILLQSRYAPPPSAEFAVEFAEFDVPAEGAEPSPSEQLTDSQSQPDAILAFNTAPESANTSPPSGNPLVLPEPLFGAPASADPTSLSASIGGAELSH